MTRAKKVILALICAAALCCAAIGGVLLARPAAEVRAEVGDLAIASVDGQIYDINTIDEIKEMLTVTRVGADGQARPIDEDEYTLTIEYEGEEVTMENGIFPESYFGTDGNRTSAEFTLTVKDASDKTASTPVTVQWAPDNAIAKMSIKSVDGAPTIYSYTDVSALEGSDYISVTVWTAAQVRSGSENGSPSYGFVSFSGDLSAPIEAVQDGKYEVELEAHYDGEILFNSYNYRVEVTAATPQSISYIRGSSSVHKLVDGESAPIVAGDTITDIVKSDLHFNVFYASDTGETVVRAVDGSDLHIVGYEYCNAAGEPLEGVNSFEWGENGNVYIKVTYQENGQPRSVRFNFQLTRSPMTAPNIMATNEATAEELNASYGEARYDLLYQYSQEGEEGVKGSPWTISFDISTAIAAITKVTDEEGTPVNDVIAEGGGSVGLTDAGTYIISLTLQSGGYSWSVDNEMTSPDGMTITYTVVIEQAELVGTKFTFGGGWTYGEEANLPAEIKLVSRVGEDTTVSFAPPAGATIKVTFTGTPNGGAQQTYSYTYTQGSEPSVTPGTNVPSLAGSYTVYVEVTGMANYADVTFANSGTNKDFKQEEFTIARKGVVVPELQDENDKQENEELGVIDYPYTGSEITVDYTSETDTAISGGSYAASGTTKSTAAGDYTVTFALADKNNTRWASETLPTTPAEDDTADKQLAWKIVKADNKITGVNDPGWTYGGAVNTPQITGSTFAENTHDLGDWSAATITYRYNDAALPVPADTLGWNVGTYSYTITYAGNANINEATYTGTFTVAKGQAVIAGTPTIAGWTYGGTANTPSGVTDVTVGGDSQVSLEEDGELPGYYAYYGTINGGTAYASENSPSQTAPKAAGTYHVVYVVKETDNYKGATAASEEFIISRASISPAVTINGQSSDAGWVYDGEEKTATVTGNLGKGSVTYTYAGRNHTTYGGSVQPTDAGEYTVNATIAQTDNYLGGEASLDFTISQKGVTVGFASDKEYTYTGAAVNVVLTVDNNQVDLTDNEYFTVVSGCKGTDAGSYTATIAWKGNYKASDTADDFATAQRSKEVGTWTIDPFAVSLPESEEYTTTFSNTQQSWTWSNYDGNDTVLTVDAFTVSVTSEPASLSGCGKGDSGLYAKYAGAYTFTLALNNEDGKTNFVWDSGTANDTADKTLTWTINKAVVTTVALGSGDDTGRQFARQEGVGQAPQISVTVNGAVGDPGLFTVEGYKTGLAGSIENQKPSDYGTYYVVLQLTDANNYQWAVNEADQNAAALGGEDTIPQENTAQLWVIYQITGTVYSISIDDISGWEYGKDTPNVPAIGGNTTALVSALNSGATISYTFERQNGNGWEKVSFDQSAYLAADGYSLTAVPEEVAGAAGMYRVSVSVTETPDNNYSAAGDVSNPFTISPYTLTEDDIAWSEPSLTYKGSAYTYGTSADNDVYARYYTYSYENGIYVRSSSADAFFSLTLTSGGDAFTDAGSYTFTASTESGNYTLPSSLAVKTYTIAQAKLTIRVTGTYEITYGEAAPTQFTFGYDTLLGNDSAAGWGVAATTDYEQYDPISSDTVKYTISIVEKDYDPNYAISYVDATLTVKAAGLRGVKIDNLTGENALTYQGAAYDIETVTGATATAVNPAQNVVTWYFSESEIASQPTNETQGIITSLTDVKRNADNTVGTYTIYYYVSAPNHAAQTGSVQIAITPAELTLTAKDASVVYGEDFTADTSINSYIVQIGELAEDTLLGSDTKESVFDSFVPSYQAYVADGDTYNAGDGVTESGYIAFDCSAPQLDNYTVTLQNGTFTVSPRAITVEIGSVPNANYGAVLNATDLSVTGIQATNGTGDGVIAGDLVQDETTGYAKYANVFTLVVKNAEGVEQTLGTALSVGVYTIEGVAGGSRTANYTITFVSGSYSVGQSTLQVVVTGASSAVYDGAAHGYTVSVSGVNDAVVNYTVKYTDSEGEDIEGQPVDAGTYTLHIETEDPNYAPYTYTTDFTITPRPIEVVWDVPTLVYNGEDQLSKVNANYYVWENGAQSADSVALTVTLQGGGLMSDAGTYTAEAAFATQDGNYTLTGAANPTTSVTISPRPIVVTIENKTSEYGDALQTLTATEALGTVTGWTDDGKGAIVPGDAKPYNLYIQDYTGGHLAVGSHNIFGSDAEEDSAIDANYDVTFRGTGSANHGVYTVSPRAVTISFAKDTYTATYGTQFDFAAAADAVTFARGTAGTSGSAFASGESFASVLNRTAFAVGAKDYSVTSAAGSAFTMQMTLGSTTAGILSVGNYTFTFTDAATLTVGQRAITVAIGNIPGAGEDELLYGTGAVADAYEKLYDYVAVTPGAGVSGGALVNGDTEESVFSLTVYGTDVVVPDDKTPAGTYYIVGAPIGGNYDITFTGSAVYDGKSAGTFIISVNGDATSGISVFTDDAKQAVFTYDGEEHYLLLTGAGYGAYGRLGELAMADGLNLRAAVNNVEWNVTQNNPFLWQFSFTDSTTTGSDGMPQFTSSVASIKDVTTQNGGVYTVYYIVYMPDNLNYAAATGSFTVKVEQATNEWANEDEYGHEGWAYNEQEADASETNPLFDGLETGSQFTAPQAVFGTAYNQEDGTVSGVTFTYYSDDTYAESARIADPDTFFTYNTPADTYYVKVEVAGTDNYTGLTGYYELVVSKHILSVRWNPENLTVDDGLSGTSVLGYNDRFMTYVAADLTVTASGTSFTAEKPANTGRYGATFIIKDELLANYEWANADGNDAANCTIYFTVSEAENVVTVTITTNVGGTEGWTYGDSVTFAAYQLGSAGQNGTIVVTATSMQSVSYAYARDVAGVTDGSDSRLVYNISALPTDAGTYWVRAYVTGDIDEGYGNKAGYAKFTVAKYQVAVPTAGALLGGDGGVYDGSVQTYLPMLDGFTWDTNNYGMAALTLENGEQVILRVSGNRAIDAGTHTAKVSPVDPDNYVWEDGSAVEKELEWSIEKQTLARPFIGEDGKYSLTTTYSPSTTMQELIGFNAEVMGFAGAAYGSSYYYANDTSYLSAGNAGEYWISISLKYPQNYQWATGDGYNGEDADAYTRLTWTITKAEFDIADYADIRFAVGEYVYNGQVQYPRLEDAGNLPSGVRLVGYEVTAGNGTDAGSHTVTAIFALTGSHADNYTFAAGGDALEQEYTIAKAVISDVTWTVQKHYTYTGEDQFEVVKAYYGLGGSIHELQVDEQSFEDYREGGYTFTVKGFRADDENAKNYKLSGTFSETFYIDKLSVYIVVGEATGDHTYDGQRPTLTEYGFRKVSVYGMDGDDLRDKFIEKYDQADWEANMRFALLDADGNTPSAWNVGEYTVTVTGAEKLQNYDVTRIQTGTLKIEPATITIEAISSPGAAFGDDTFGPAAVTAVSGLVAGETIDVLNFLYTYTGTADDGWSADGTLTNEMHAGSYTVTVSLQGGNYVLAGNVSYSYKVSPMLVDPALVEIDDLLYTGQAQTLTKEDTRFTGTGSAYDLFDYSVAAESGTEVGGYRVTLIIGNANYLWQSGAAGYGNMTTDRTWRIVEAQAEDISVSLPQVSITHWGKTAASVTAGGSVAAIGGTEISVNITYLFEVKDESGSWVEFTGSVWNAGDYRVRAEAASDNFPAAYSEYHEFTVQPGVYDVSGLAFADMTLTYDGQAHGLVLTVNGSAAAGGSIGGGALGATGTVAYTLGGAETDAGTYTMTATLTAGANYTFAGGETTYELTGTLVIEPYTVTIRWAEDDFTYDKQDHSGDVWAYFIGAGNSHIDLVLEGADEMVDAGEYTFTVTGASDQSGAAVDLANYMLAGGDVAGAQKEYTVRKFAATVNWGQTSFTYNGEDQSASVQPSFIGVGGEEIALSVSPQALRDFGTYTVAAVIGAELKNYELSNTTAQISIAKLPVTVTADDISAALGAAEQTLTYTLAPSEAAEVFAADEAAGRVEVSLSRVPGTAAGAYDIYISVTGEGAENYALTLVGGTYTIRERAIELSITLPADLVYSGAPKAAVLIAKEVGGGEIAVPAGISLWYEGKDNAGAAYASAQAPVNAGSYTVGVRIDTQDYDVSNANITVEMTIERAEASIDVSGVQTQYTYTGALQRVEGGAVLSHGESALVYSNNTFTSVSEGDGKVVSVDAAMSCNYKAAHAEVTISVAKAAISPAVTIRGWTYGQSANGYTVTGNPGGGAIEAVYGGTTNAGAAYSGGQAPTEAGSYTLTVTVAETENYLGGSASTSFTVARAALHVSVSIEGWAFGESPNGYTVSPASMRGNISSVRYEGEGYSGSQPPTQVGSYTLTVTFAQTANYQGGSASDSFSITQGTLAPDSVRLTIEGWTYGEAPNSPVLTGAPAGAEVSYRYSGTANDGTAWNSDTAPSKAGSYKVTAHISAEGYASFEAEASFTVARRLVSAPTLGDTGGRTASSVYDGEEVRIAVTGYDGALMDFTAEEGTQLVMEGQQLLLAADAEGTYVLQVSLKDIFNYGWADLAEGEQIAGDIALAWEVTLAMHSLLWLIILLFILLLILIALLIVFAKKDHDARARIAAAQQGAESGADGAADERQNYALAPAGLLFAVPVWQISLIAALAVAAAVLLVADVVLLVLWRKDAAKAERAEEAVQAAAAAAQDENLQAENAQEAGGDENSASAE